MIEKSKQKRKKVSNFNIMINTVKIKRGNSGSQSQGMHNFIKP